MSNATYSPTPLLLAEADLQTAYAELGSISVLSEVQQEIEENLALEKELHALLVKRFIYESAAREKQLEERHRTEQEQLQHSWQYERARLQSQVARLEQQHKEKDALILQLQAEKSDAIQAVLAERRDLETQRRDDRRVKELERQLRDERANNELNTRALQLQIHDLEDQLGALQASRTELLKFLSSKLHSNADAAVLDQLANELRARSPPAAAAAPPRTDARAAYPAPPSFASPSYDQHSPARPLRPPYTRT